MKKYEAVTFEDQQNVEEAKSELQDLGSNLQGQTALEDHRKAVLIQHIKDLKDSNRGWVNRMLLPREDKQMLKVYGEKQIEAVEIVLGNQNEALNAVCSAQVAFVRQVCNVLLQTGRSGMQGAAAVIFRENALAMQVNLERIQREFYSLVEAKYHDAQNRLPFVQKQIMGEIDLMMQKWRQDGIRIQDDFSAILAEKV